MNRIRVFIIDGDVVSRQTLVRLLRNHTDLTVCGVTGDGRTAEGMMPAAKPDVLLLDLEGIRADGLHILCDLHERYPDMAIIAMAVRTPEGARLAMGALQCGAVDILTKPQGIDRVVFATRHIGKRLIPIIRAVKSRTARLSGLLPGGISALPVRHRAVEPTATERAELIVIGGCTGGLQALFTLLPELPIDQSVPVLIAQHMPKGFAEALAQKLGAVSQRDIALARTGDFLRANAIVLAPGGTHMSVHRSGNQVRVETHRGPRENDCRPSIDVLFRSAADTFGSRVLAIILSGHGADGIEGCRHVRNAGGRVMVQDPGSASADDLPATVIMAGLAESVLTPVELGREIACQAIPDRQALPSFGNLAPVHGNAGRTPVRREGPVEAASNAKRQTIIEKQQAAI